MPCLAHVLNLAVQAILGKDGLAAQAPADAESLDVDDDHIEPEGDQLMRVGLADGEEEEEESDLESSDEPPTVSNILRAEVDIADHSKMTQRALVKLRKGIVKIRYISLL